MRAPSLERLKTLQAAAERAREEDREEALEDVRALTALLPVPKSGRARQDAAAILARLDEPRVLRALGAKSIEQLIAGAKLRLSGSTARRLIREHEARPATKSQLRRLSALEKRIRKRLRDGDANAWEIGKDFDRIAKRRLHRVTPERTLAAWADARYPNHGYRTLSRYRRIAKSFAKSTARRHGTTKLDLGLTYLDLTPANERPAELIRLEIEVPGKGFIPFTEITVADLDRAVTALRTRVSTPTPKPLPRGAARLAERLAHSLAAVHVAEGQPKPTITARAIRAGNKIVPLFSAQDLPMNLAARLISANGDQS